MHSTAKTRFPITLAPRSQNLVASHVQTHRITTLALNSSNSEEEDPSTLDEYISRGFISSIDNMQQTEFTPPVITAADFVRLNEDDDGKFYETPRMTYHVTPTFRETLTALYQQKLSAGERVLDLCSSFDSHLPPNMELTVIGHGMNALELQKNERLTNFFIQDFNQSASMALGSNEFDAVLMCCGIQYLIQPLLTLGEIRRVLKPGGKVIITISSDCFEQKAISGWLSRDMQARSHLVNFYLTTAGLVDIETHHVADVDFVAVIASKMQGDQQPRAALGEIEFITGPHVQVSDATIERWVEAYKQQCRDAHSLGIPVSALPQLPLNPSAADIREARDYLEAMIGSFLSAGL